MLSRIENIFLRSSPQQPVEGCSCDLPHATYFVWDIIEHVLGPRVGVAGFGVQGFRGLGSGLCSIKGACLDQREDGNGFGVYGFGFSVQGFGVLPGMCLWQGRVWLENA